MVTGQDAVAPDDEMRFRLRTNRERQDGPEQVPLAPEAQGARLRSDSLEATAAVAAGTLALVAWAALAPWTMEIERSAEVPFVEVNVSGPVLLAGIAAWVAALVLGGRGGVLLADRRAPSPRSRRGVLRVRYDWVLVVPIVIVLAAVPMPLDDSIDVWTTAGPALIDLHRSPPAMASQLIAQMAVFILGLVAGRGLLVGCLRRWQPDRPAVWLERVAAPKRVD